MLWVTNLAAPYRLPVWRRLAEEVDLQVELLEPRERLAVDEGANRGDWVPGDAGFPIREARTARIKRGEGRYYFLSDPRTLRRLAAQRMRSSSGGGNRPPTGNSSSPPRLYGRGPSGSMRALWQRRASRRGQ